MTRGVSCFPGIDLYNIISWEDQNMPSSIRHERWKLLVFSLYQVCFFSLFFKNSFETWWCQKKKFSLDFVERTLFCFIFPLICSAFCVLVKECFSFLESSEKKSLLFLWSLLCDVFLFYLLSIVTFLFVFTMFKRNKTTKKKSLLYLGLNWNRRYFFVCFFP